jgi:hypothetical protein
MRLPIKLNQAGWPSLFARLPFVFHDPRPLAQESCSLSPAAFSQAVSTLQFGVTFKTTHPGRHQYSNRFISEVYCASKPVILDVGASDGSTSLDLIDSLSGNFARYFVTDLNLTARCGYDDRGVLYFVDHNDVCVLRASPRFLVYSDVAGARFPLPIIAKALLARHRNVGSWRDVLLIQPELVRHAGRDPRITIERYDLFTPWTGERPDLIKVANLLNGKYFTDTQMKEALRIQHSNLPLNGRLLLVSEDHALEKFSVFRKTSTGMVLEHAHGGGAKASGHVDSVVGVTSHVNGWGVQEGRARSAHVRRPQNGHTRVSQIWKRPAGS